MFGKRPTPVPPPVAVEQRPQHACAAAGAAAAASRASGSCRRRPRADAVGGPRRADHRARRPASPMSAGRRHRRSRFRTAVDSRRSETYYETKRHDLRRADRGDRSRPARQARRRFRARGNPRHRQRDHRDQEHRDVDRRAGRSARRHLQRRARLRPARAAARARRHRRHHGQWLGHGLHRSRRQDSEDRHPLPRQSAAAEHLPAHRQPGRPPRRRILADLRRALAGRLARQRHRAAAGDRRPRAHHPQVQEGQADARAAGQVTARSRRRAPKSSK